MGARRCNGGLSHEAFLAKRRADYAANIGGIKDKQKSRYAGKVGKPGVAFAAPTPVAEPVDLWSLPDDIRRSIEIIDLSTLPEKLHKDYEHYEGVLENIKHAAAASQKTDADFANLEVVEEDINFADENETLNEVRFVQLEDGAQGYFKPILDIKGEEEFASSFKMTSMEMAVHEVAASELCKALGSGFDKLVPTTVLREYEDQFGSFQAEARGELVQPYSGWNEDTYDWDDDEPDEDMVPVQLWKDVKPEAYRKAAIADFLMNPADRHGGNVLMNKHSDEMPFSLIDNGINFSAEDPVERITPFVYGDGAQNRIPEELAALSSSEQAAVQKLYDDPTHGGLSVLLTPDRFLAFKERLHELVTAKRVPNGGRFHDV